ncbi:hypothetical protein EV143_11816 [Flavobacterium chryseum]|uniref:hypothetical protein n=1 Tax=Flavobacterium sp. P3160 TaxID=2512113 RepID=UPI00105D35A0|nr:hypothetical protein [Flavobacterium sp. P3160]TDO68832.1 hypothetical protein EV143_11816 [Flavobacterium sp. P3160]
MEKRKIIELDIDVDAIIAKSSQLKTELDKSRESLSAMKKAGDTSSETYIQMSAKINKLSSDYNMNQKQLVNLITVDEKFLTINEKVNLALDHENKSITEARQNNTELLKIRNELNLADENQLKLLDEINAKIDANDKFIKENVSELEKQKIGIGDYTTAIKDAISESGLFGGELAVIGEALKKSSKLFQAFKDDIVETAQNMRNAADGTETMTFSQKALTIATNLGTGAMRIFALAIAATGIGLIVIAIALLISYLKTFTPVVDAVEQGMAGLGAVIKVVQQGIMSFVSGLSDLGGTLKKIGSFLADPIKGFKEMGKAMGDAYDAAAKLKKAQQDLEDAMESQEIQTAKNRAEINRLNIQAKDRTKSEEERLDLLKRAAQLEEEDFQQRKKNNDEQLRLALLQIKNEAKLTDIEFAELQKRGFAYKDYIEKKTNNTDELFDNLKKAILADTDITNEYYSNQEKNINKQNKLLEDQEAAREKARQAAIEAEKKRQEASQKLLDDAARKAKAELDLFISQQGVRAKTLAEGLKYQEQIRDKKLEIAQKEFDATKKTEIDKLKFLTDQNNIQNEFLKAQMDFVIANANAELQLFLDNNKSKLDANKFLTDELVAQEIDRLNRISEAEAAFQTKRLEEGQINAQEYQDAIKAIDDKFAEEKKVLEEEKEQADFDKKAIDLENKLATDQLNADNEFAFRQAELQRLNEAELLAAKKNGADIDLINQKYAAQKKSLDKSLADFKINQELAVIQGLRGIVSEQSALGKALALAEITFTTVKNATQAFQQAAVFASNPLTAALAVNATIQGGIIIASGALQAAKVSGLKLAKGAVNIDGPGTGTSDSIPAMLSKGESVITAEATSNNEALIAAMNANAGIDFSSQFLPSSVIQMYSNTNNSQGIDYDLLAAKVAEANLNLPKPIVYTAVTDINYEQDEYAKITDGADLWAS